MSDSVLNVFLYGSCVSRDTAEFRGSSWNRLGYVARQSLISAMSTPIAMPSESGLSSKFQNAMVRGDFSSSLLPDIAPVADKIDRMVIDLVDERLGVYPYPGNKFLTYSNELHHSALMQKMKGREAFLAFGSEQHFDLWSTSALKFKEALEESQLLHKSRVIVAPFVDRTLEGGQVALTRNLDAGEWNSQYLRYYNLLDQIGFELVELPAEYVVSTVKHKWGSAQYHYIDAAYDALAGLIE